jgi:hypothetical protein
MKLKMIGIDGYLRYHVDEVETEAGHTAPFRPINGIFGALLYHTMHPAPQNCENRQTVFIL